MENDLKNLRAIYDAGLQAVDPYNAIKNMVSFDKATRTLKVADQKYHLTENQKIYVVGGGKGNLAMTKAINDILGSQIEKGIINVYREQADAGQIGNIELHPGDHPLPNEAGAKGAAKMVELASQLGKDDILISLISGGGSDILACPREGLTIDDFKVVARECKKTPMNVGDINIIRRHLDLMKGGKLRRAARNVGTSITMTLSDVPTLFDDVSVPGSGPTVGHNGTFTDAWKLIEDNNLVDKFPESCIQYIKDGIAGKYPPNPRTDDPLFANDQSELVGSNKIMCKAAAKRAQELGYDVSISDFLVDGEVQEVTRIIFKEVMEAMEKLPNKPQMIIFGGEPYVNVEVDDFGEGGRNTMATLLFAKKIMESKEKISRLGYELAVLCGASDGIDGTCYLAGGLIDPGIINKIDNKEMQDHLDRFDSATYLEKIGAAIKTGPSGTNVADMIAFTIVRSPKLKSWESSLKDLLEVRMGLECNAAALAAQRADEEDILVMENCLKEIQEEVRSGRPGSEADASFHMAIANATKNPTQLHIMKNFYYFLLKGIEESYLHLYEESTQIETIREHHTQIVHAIKNHDSEKAFNAMKLHISHVMDFFGALQ